MLDPGRQAVLDGLVYQVKGALNYNIINIFHEWGLHW
jgi:hypothetical protein